MKGTASKKNRRKALPKDTPLGVASAFLIASFLPPQANASEERVENGRFEQTTEEPIPFIRSFL